ncbi:MAG: tyrosine-type recombinase/integrase [Alistipes sp.]|nr:tyrosine-type recombinase/integrase [Alistipes sp.]
MDRGSKAAGVKRIRIHDLRHSHVSMLINQGFSAVDIANRVGHESVDITFRYAHMFPTTQKEIVVKGSPKTYKALKNTLCDLMNVLKENGSYTDEQWETLQLATQISEGFKNNEE